MTRRQAVERALGRPARRYREVEEGWDFVVVVVDEAWAFRFPRRAAVVPPLETEIALLPELADRLPVAVPRFEHVVRSRPAFVGYRLIEGEPLPPGARLAATDVGRFLSALHAFDPERAHALGVPRSDWQEHYREQCAEFERRVLPLVPSADRPQAERLLAETTILVGFTATLLHADLGPGHLLCRGDRLAGVIDWGDACVGDPALDLSWLLHELRAPAVDALLAAYGGAPDTGFGERARFYHALAPWYEAHCGVFTDQPALVVSGLEGIQRRLP